MPEDTGRRSSSLPPELVQHTLLCLDSSGSFISTTPRDTGAVGIGGMIHRCCCTSGLSAQLLFSGSMEIRIHMQVTALQHAIGIAPGLQPLQPAQCLFHQAHHLVLWEPLR